MVDRYPVGKERIVLDGERTFRREIETGLDSIRLCPICEEEYLDYDGFCSHCDHTEASEL